MENIITRLFVTFPVKNAVILALHLTIIMPLLMVEWNYIGKMPHFPLSRLYAYDCISSIYKPYTSFIFYRVFKLSTRHHNLGTENNSGDIYARHSLSNEHLIKMAFRVKLRQPNSKKAKNYHDICYRKNPIQVRTNSTGIRVLPLTLFQIICVGVLRGQSLRNLVQNSPKVFFYFRPF